MLVRGARLLLLRRRFLLVFRLPLVVGHAVDDLARLRVGDRRCPAPPPPRDTSATGSCGRSRRNSSGRCSARRCARADAATRRRKAAASSSVRVLSSMDLSSRGSSLSLWGRHPADCQSGALPHRARPRQDRLRARAPAAPPMRAAPASVVDQILAELDRDMRQAARYARDGAPCSPPARAPNRAGCRRRPAPDRRAAPRAAAPGCADRRPTARRHARAARTPLISGVKLWIEMQRRQRRRAASRAASQAAIAA